MLTSFIFPLVFVVLWASAFTAGSVATQDGTPFAILALRFSLVSCGFILVAIVLNELPKLSKISVFHGVVTGVLFHGFYLGGVFYAVSVGFPAGVVALIVCTQPILTATFSRLLLSERVSIKNWIGICFGFAGTVMVLGPDIDSRFAIDGLMASITALAAITIGTIWQRKYSLNLPLATNNAVQALSATLFHLAVMWFLEDPAIGLTTSFALSMGWLIIAVSFGAFSILMYLINQNSATKTSALFFLVPPVAAFIGWGLLDEGLSYFDMFGFFIASCGVYLATRAPGKSLR